MSDSLPVRLTEVEIRDIFNKQISGDYQVADTTSKIETLEFKKFFDTYYSTIHSKYLIDPLPYALQEEYIDTTKIDSSRHWFRIIVNPCFRKPYCFVVELTKNRTKVITKISSGAGCYFPGVLTTTMTSFFPDTLYYSIKERLKAADFWSLKNDTTCHGGFDGESWQIESIDSGNYNLVSRWAPQFCGTETTHHLAQIGIQLAKLTKLDPILKVIGAPKSGM